jgi:hypothetical protein
MKRFLIIMMIINAVACNDGDMDVPSFEFEQTIHFCGSYVLYRNNSTSTEALILHLSPADFSGTTVTTIPLAADVCSYRIFDAAFDQDYFCSDIPPVTPVVTRVWYAEPGEDNYLEIIPANTGTEENPVYTYHLIMHNLVLTNEEEQMIFNTYDYGEITLP